jgi:hypothetical protein
MLVELGRDPERAQRGLDRVRQPLARVPGLGLKEERSATVEREPESDRHSLRPRVFSFHQQRIGQAPELALAASDRLPAQRHLCRASDRPIRVGDGSSEGGGDIAANARLCEVVRSQPVRQGR